MRSLPVKPYNQHTILTLSTSCRDRKKGRARRVPTRPRNATTRAQQAGTSADTYPYHENTTGFTSSEASDVLPNLSYGQTLLCPGPDGHWRRHPETLPQLAKPLITMGVIVLFPSFQPSALETSRRHRAVYINFKIRPIPSFERTFHYPSVLLPLHFIFADLNP